MIFLCIELFFVNLRVFHDFQSLWEPWSSELLSLNIAISNKILCAGSDILNGWTSYLLTILTLTRHTGFFFLIFFRPLTFFQN